MTNVEKLEKMFKDKGWDKTYGFAAVKIMIDAAAVTGVEIPETVTPAFTKPFEFGLVTGAKLIESGLFQTK